MGDILVLFIGLKRDSIEHVAAAPSGLSRQQRKEFLQEASRRFETQMSKCSALNNWMDQNEWSVKRFAAAMKEAREQAPLDERWKLGSGQSHQEMARGALVMYEVMTTLLPKYGKHPKRDSELCREDQADVDVELDVVTSGGAVIDGGANGVVISPQTAERKGLLEKVDRTTKVSLSQAEKEKKMETYGVIQGGVTYKMLSKHGRLVTITLLCHMAPVNNDLIGANEQGPILQGIKGVMYLEYTRPDGRRGTCLIMPDGEIVPLPADDRGLTMFPEIGQERHWVKESYLLEIEELCELLMSKERVRRMRKDMPDPTSDSVMPAATDQSGAAEKIPTKEVIDLPTEADSKSIVTQRSDAQTQASELPLVGPSGRLTTKDFVILTDCSVCGLPGLNTSWIWEKATLLDTYGIIQDRSAQMELQRTLICESCYRVVIHDGGFQTTEGWWMFDNEYEKARMKEARANVARRRQGPEDYRQDAEPVNAACEVVEGNSPKHAETSRQAGVSGNNHIEEDLDEVGWLPADASEEWREGVKASLELNQFRWRRIVEESLESFEQEELKRTAAEAKFEDQLRSDLVCATNQSLREGRRDRMEQVAGPANLATQLTVTRMQVDRRKVDSDELTERRKEAKKEEDENEKQRQLVIERKKAADRVRTAVMALIEVKRAQAKEGSRKGKGTKNRPWETELSARALELVKIEVLLNRAREAGVDEVELQLALQACGPHGW